MSNINHPLIAHLKSTGESLASFARRAEMSRMQLYRIMSGQNTTVDRLKKISNATGGEVPLSAFTGPDASGEAPKRKRRAPRARAEATQ